MARIAAFGFYHHCNAGDDRLQQCITRFALEHRHSVVFLPHQEPVPFDYLRQFDWALIGGGGLAMRRQGVFADCHKWISRSGVRVGVWGLGVSHAPPDLHAELVCLADRAEFFFVRDARSQALIGHPAVEIYPDLSFLYPYPALNRREPGTGIAFNVFPVSWKTMAPDAWSDQLVALGENVRPWPFYFSKDWDLGYLQKRYGTDQVGNEFTLDPLLECELVIAARFHAILFAIQMQVPFLAILYDHKVKQLLEEAGLSEFGLETDQSHRLPEKIALIRENKDAFRRKMNDYCQNMGVLTATMREKVSTRLQLVRHKPPLWRRVIQKIRRKAR